MSKEEEDDETIHISVRRRKAKNRPKESAWRQQKLAAYRPVLNAQFAFIPTLILGLMSLGMGVYMHISAQNSLEFEQEYTKCIDPQTGLSESNRKDGEPMPNIQCQFNINLAENYTGRVRFYYGLDGFYQNTRLYMASRSERQLSGDPFNVDDCDPLTNRIDPTDGIKKKIAPCGLIADSLFNDTFSLSTDDGYPVPFTARDVLPDFLRKQIYKNPPFAANQTLCDAFEGTVRPPSWTLDVCQLGAPFVEDEAERENIGTGFENIDLIMWMRTAALPKFRKLYRILDNSTDEYSDGLPAGDYIVRINYNYPTAAWHGKKFFVIAAEPWGGGRHYFLSISLMVVGVFLILVSSIFFLLALRMKFMLKQRMEKSNLPQSCSYTMMNECFNITENNNL